MLSLCGLRSLGLQRVLGGGDQFVKCGRIRRGEIGQNLAIQPDLRGLQPSHKTAVSHAGGACGGVDANLPKRAVIALCGLAIAEGVLPAMIERIGGAAVKFAATHPEALGGFNCPDTAFTGSWTVRYAYKILNI